MKKTFAGVIAFMVLVSMCVTGIAAKETKYYLTKEKDRVKMQHDNGFETPEKIEKEDPHFEWGLGYFYIQGYTEIVFENDGTPVFLKNVGDELILGFELKENIDKLRGKDDLKVSEDTNGFDKTFEVKQTNFGKGCLIVVETDYRNKAHKPAIYTDYLTAVQKKTANTKVKPFAEGDYEIALDYELQSPGFLGSPVYNDYQIKSRFKIRNSNCMVFFYKLGESKDEITNGAVAEDGFKIDFKNSYFLNVTITKEILVDNDGVLTLDTRYNKAASDGSQYNEEGLYTITVSNQYTNEKTTKRISVGRNKVLNVYAAHNGTMDLNEIAKKLDQGVEINSQWMMILPEASAEDNYNTQTNNYSGFMTPEGSETSNNKSNGFVTPVNTAVFALVVIILIMVLKQIEKKKKKTESGKQFVQDIPDEQSMPKLDVNNKTTDNPTEEEKKE